MERSLSHDDVIVGTSHYASHSAENSAGTVMGLGLVSFYDVEQSESDTGYPAQRWYAKLIKSREHVAKASRTFDEKGKQ